MQESSSVPSCGCSSHTLLVHVFVRSLIVAPIAARIHSSGGLDCWGLSFLEPPACNLRMTWPGRCGDKTNEDPEGESYLELYRLAEGTDRTEPGTGEGSDHSGPKISLSDLRVHGPVEESQCGRVPSAV